MLGSTDYHRVAAAYMAMLGFYFTMHVQSCVGTLFSQLQQRPLAAGWPVLECAFRLSSLLALTLKVFQSSLLCTSFPANVIPPSWSSTLTIFARTVFALEKCSGRGVGGGGADSSKCWTTRTDGKWRRGGSRQYFPLLCLSVSLALLLFKFPPLGYYPTHTQL